MTLFFEGDDSTYVDNKSVCTALAPKTITTVAGMLYWIVGTEETASPSMVAWIIRFRWPEPVDTVSSWPTKCPMRRKSIMEWNMVK